MSVIIRTQAHVKGGRMDKSGAMFAPYIDAETGTWWQYNKENQMFEDTLVNPAGIRGEKGDPGDAYIITPEDVQYLLSELRSQIVADADMVNGHTVESDVPEDAVFTDTTYSAATTSADGLMSATDKSKLDGVGTAGTFGYTVVSTF